MTEKIITINGQQVIMCYCAATESGYEQISEKCISVFVPTFGKDDEGNTVVTEPAKATIGDFVALGYAAIVAAYAKRKQQAPVSFEYILYDATPEERNELLEAIVELRTEWYQLTKVVEDQLKREEDRKQTDEEPAKN